MSRTIFTQEDLYSMLDGYFRDDSRFWDSFYHNRARNIPFFQNAPDENLVTYFDRGYFQPGKVLEFGCGPGRNAIYMTKQGCTVDALDISVEALNWAQERAEEQKVSVNFQRKSIFEFPVAAGSYDIVYDSGCFHHLAPHRRFSYLTLVEKALKPGGMFGLVCFNPDGGAPLTDAEVYRKGWLGGGLAYTEDDLYQIFSSAFEIIELRRMREFKADEGVLGYAYCWAVLLRRK